jgi:hypothetical protein
MPQTEIRLFQDHPRTIPPLKGWLDRLEESEPKAYAKCLERILQLEQFGYELRRPATDMLRDGVKELRARSGSVNYRILYFFRGANVAYLSHGITKEGRVPDAEVELALAREEMIKRDEDLHTAEWEV